MIPVIPFRLVFNEYSYHRHLSPSVSSLSRSPFLSRSPDKYHIDSFAFVWRLGEHPPLFYYCFSQLFDLQFSISISFLKFSASVRSPSLEIDDFFVLRSSSTTNPSNNGGVSANFEERRKFLQPWASPLGSNPGIFRQ